MGLSLDASLAVTEKLEPSMRPLTSKVSPALVLHVTPSFAPRDESSVRNIWLSAVIAEVWTVVETVFAGIRKLPAAADPQSAGLVLDAHFVSVPKDDETRGWPLTLQTVPAGHAESTDAALLANSNTSLSEAVPCGIR
jgi:hypothetical protein